MQTNGNKGTFTGGAKDFIVAKGNTEKKRKEKKRKERKEKEKEKNG